MQANGSPSSSLHAGIWSHEKNRFEIVREDSLGIKPRSHVLHYGTGVFEGIPVHQVDARSMAWFPNNTEEAPSWGRAIFRPDSYISRLWTSAALCHMPDLPFTEKQIIDCMKQLLQKNPPDHNYLRPLIFRGVPEEYQAFGLIPDAYPVGMIIMTGKFSVGMPAGKDALDYMVTHIRRPDFDQGKPQAKTLANYQIGIDAIATAKAKDYDGGLLLAPNGRHISEAEVANLLVVFDDEIATPSEDCACLPGITLATAIHIIEKRFAGRLSPHGQKIPRYVTKRPIASHELFSAKEIILTGSASRIRAIRSLNGMQIGTGTMGPVAQQLSVEYLHYVTGRHDINLIEFIPPGPGQKNPTETILH